MARILLAVLAVGITIYALVDWIIHSRVRTPGGLNRWVWLAVIILIPVAGPLAWIVLTQVGRAEDRQNPTRIDRAPDDDPEYLREVSERILRRQKRSPRDATKPPQDDADAEDSDLKE